MQAVDRRRVKLSRFLALILRHQPARFGLAPDAEGWVGLAEVLEILHGLPNFRWATRLDVTEIAQRGSGDGRLRFELDGGRIRYRPTQPPLPVEPPAAQDGG
jgi:putative RNA 2'-phosphotransferase